MLVISLLFLAGFVDIATVNARIRLDIRYATTNNFTHQKVYDAARCVLREGTARKLDDVQQDLERMGLGLKVFDCYRPLEVQRKFWAILPDERYVADPSKGSRHNRGAAVDLTLVTAGGQELQMPTAFDDFSEKAHRDYQTLPPAAIRNRALLERVMKKHGFIPLPTEWWHFDDADWRKYPIE